MKTNDNGSRVASRDRRLKVLVSAYACCPHRGSEPGVGWNVATHLARYHDVFVLTTLREKRHIERELAARPIPGLNVYYFSLGFDRNLKGVGIATQLHSILWQLTIIILARRLHRQHHFDLAHQVTLSRYWFPNSLAFLGIPFIFGPVGGAESTPGPFLRMFGPRECLGERLRDLIKALAERNPILRASLRHSAVAIGYTPIAADALKRAGAAQVETCLGISLSNDDVETLSRAVPAPPNPFRVITISRLVAWKGVDLAIRAFKAAGLPATAEYWIFGDGEQKRALRRLAEKLGIAHQAIIVDDAARSAVLEQLGRSHVMIYPCLRDSRGWVCLEAMAAGIGIICVDQGGSGHPVPDSAGYKIIPTTPDAVVTEMAARLRELSDDREKLHAMGAAGRAFVRANLTWDLKIERFLELYDEIAQAQPSPTLWQTPQGALSMTLK